MLSLSLASFSWSAAAAPRFVVPSQVAPQRAAAVPIMYDRYAAQEEQGLKPYAKDALPETAKKAGAQWEVHKFGGASLATAELYKQCSELLVSESQRGLEKYGSAVPTMAIVSAKGGVTDRLIKVVEASLTDMDTSAELLRAITDEQVAVVKELAGAEIASEVEARMRSDETDILNVVRAVGLLRAIPPSTMELVTGYGEVWSAMTMHAYLRGAGYTTAWLDARDVLIVEQVGFGLGDKGSSNVVGVDPLWDISAERVLGWFNDRPELLNIDTTKAAPIVVVTGFVASTMEGSPTTLKRSGSDYSATIFAKIMGGSAITMWKNVNGVYTADPRRVPEAFPIESLKYDEAIELAYFGAQVLHPSAMAPCIEGRIPIYVRNVFNPSHPGTSIEGRAISMKDSSESWQEDRRLKPGESPIKGITSVDNVAILNIEGTGTSAVPDLSSRIFETLRIADVQPVMVTQASADASMCVAIEEALAGKAIAALEQAFQFELSRGDVAGINVEYDHSIVAIVGEGMAFRPGTGATFTKAMANAGVNIRTIAQGSSERQISICVERKDCTKALRAAHSALALSNTELIVAVIGATGLVGSALLEQLAESERTSAPGIDTQGKRKVMDDLNIEFQVAALLKGDKMRLSYNGFDVRGGARLTGPDAADDVKEADLDELTVFLDECYNGNRVIIDCTSSEDVAGRYSKWLGKGIHIVSANKKAGSGDLAYYHECVDKTRGGASAQWYYETTGPGSGLPVLTTLKDMAQSGDRVYEVSGVFSGSLSYMLNKMHQGEPLSAALSAAIAKGLCEPNPRDDLTGTDVRRKVVVLARELGLEMGFDSVEVDSLMPEALKSWQPDTGSSKSVAEQLVEALKPHDDEMREYLAAKIAKSGAGSVPVQISRVNVEAGSARVTLEGASDADRVSRLKPNENIIEISSRRYSASPMVLQGPGAGAEITASGLFADLLHLSRTLVE